MGYVKKNTIKWTELIDDVMNIEPIYSLNYSKMLSINSLISTIHSVLNLLNIFAPTQNPQSYPPPLLSFLNSEDSGLTYSV